MVEAYHISPKDKTLRTQVVGALHDTSEVWDFYRVDRRNLFGVHIRLVIKHVSDTGNKM